MDIYIYLGLLLFLMFIIYDEFTKAVKYCPVKIKGILIITFCLVIFRLAALFTLLISDRAELVYVLRNLVFLNIVYMPLVMFICIYIFYRNINMSIKWIYGVFAASLAFYLLCIFLVPMEYYISLSYGYNIVFNNVLPYKLFLCIYGAAFFIGMKGMKYQYSLKGGMLAVEAASVASVVMMALSIRSTESIGLLLIGESLFFIVLYIAIGTFKKKAV